VIDAPAETGILRSHPRERVWICSRGPATSLVPVPRSGPPSSPLVLTRPSAFLRETLTDCRGHRFRRQVL